MYLDDLFLLNFYSPLQIFYSKQMRETTTIQVPSDDPENKKPSEKVKEKAQSEELVKEEELVRLGNL
jgi:hypothetical protein